MKKLYVVLLVLAVAFSFAAPAMAKQGLSVGLGMGILPNCAGMGATILDDGLNLHKNTPTATAGLNVYNEVKLLRDEQSLTDDEKAGTISNLETNGPMMGMDFALQVRYDYSYFFARTGLNYAKKVAGGETTWTKVSTGAKYEQNWDYSSLAIPLTLGINIPALDGKLNLYMGFSMAYMRGSWEVEIVAPDLDLKAPAFNGAAWVTSLAGLGFPGASETPKFEASGLAMGYLIGVDAEVYENVAIFFEYESLTLAEIDTYNIKNAWFKAGGVNTLSYTSIVGGSFIRFGAKYHLGYAM